MEIKAGSSIIGDNHSTFIIAEAGSNHNQDLSKAKKMIDVAAKAGVDAVKFQTFTAEKIAARTDDEIMKLESNYQDTANNLFDLYKELEMPREWLPKLRDYAREKELVFLSTPFDYKAVDILDELGIPVFKIASFECIDLPFLKYIAKKEKPIILSTGMANLGEIEEALEVIYAQGNKQVILLHCGINYPLAFSDVNLRVMDTLKRAFQIPVGYSDHTRGIAVPISVVARGGTVLEKHFTLDRTLPGPDHKFALEPEEMKNMVKGIRRTEKALGRSVKKTLSSEKIHYKRGRRSIFAVTDISQDTVIKEDMIGILRPGIGLKPKFYDIIIGRKAKKDIKANEPITWDKI